MTVRAIIYLALFAVYVASVGGSLYLGVSFGKAKRDQDALSELDAALSRTFELEVELDEQRKKLRGETRERVQVIRETVDSCADAVPAADIDRVLDESDTAQP